MVADGPTTRQTTYLLPTVQDDDARNSVAGDHVQTAPSHLCTCRDGELAPSHRESEPSGRRVRRPEILTRNLFPGGR